MCVLFKALLSRLPLCKEIIFVIDDTLVKKWGRNFFGLGCYPDPTDKNPGVSRRRVWDHCWVVLALLWECGPGRWFCFPLGALLFIPEVVCSQEWPFLTKIELAVRLLKSLCPLNKRVIVEVDNLGEYTRQLKFLEPLLTDSKFFHIGTGHPGVPLGADFIISAEVGALQSLGWKVT